MSSPIPVAHSWTIYTRGLAYVARHRWMCSCRRCGTWQKKVRSARNGGARHVAAMEKK